MHIFNYAVLLTLLTIRWHKLLVYNLDDLYGIVGTCGVKRMLGNRVINFYTF